MPKVDSRRRVLFVCMGNICRSPAGEGALLRLARERCVDQQLTVDSAGTHSYHSGEPADARMREAAERRGYELPSRARQARPRDFEQFDLILAMDRDNLEGLQAIEPESSSAELRLLSSFLPADGPVEVPDPYYGGEQGFEVVLDMVEQAAPAILDHLLPTRT